MAAALDARGGSPPDAELAFIDADGRVEPDRAEAVEALWRPVGTGGRWIEELLPRLPSLAWIHSDSVGIDTLPCEEIFARGIVLTNGVGIYSRPMAEWALLALLAAAKRFGEFLSQSQRGLWSTGTELRELEGARVLLFGLGSVNTLLAAMLEPFNAQVHAIVRTPRADPVPGVRQLVPFSDWREQLPDADYVVLGLPLTAATRGLVDQEAFARMKPTTWLVNLARGALVDEQALIQALDRGLIGGAVLDAYVEEPLPAGNGLWHRPNVVVVPHFTWSSPAIIRRRGALFCEQLSAWLAGAPLANVVDPVAGY